MLWAHSPRDGDGYRGGGARHTEWVQNASEQLGVALCPRLSCPSSLCGVMAKALVSFALT